MINNGIHTGYNITINSIIVFPLLLYSSFCGVHFRENISLYNGRIMRMSRSPSARGRELRLYVLLPLHNT